MKVLTENNMEMLDGRSMDIIANNIEKLRAIFPEVFCEDKVDFEKLQEVLGNYIEDKEERYRFEWNGKSQAIRIAQTPSTGTLRPCKEESKNWDTTQNLYIEGDNLEVLKLLQKSYQNKIKMIYIDPPYNTGNDFVYEDDYKDNIRNYLFITGQLNELGNKFSTNSDESGRYHTNWLNMMYPRLRLAKNLLREDGVIFISIDDKEVFNLKKICDEIFGEENFISNIGLEITKTQGMKVKAAKEGSVVKNYEYILVYAKNNLNKNIVKNVLYDANEGYDTHFSYYIDRSCGSLNLRKLTDELESKKDILDEFIKLGLTKNNKISINSIEKAISISEKVREYIFNEISSNIYQEMACNIKIDAETEKKLCENKIVEYRNYLLTKSSGGKLRQFSSLKETLNYSDEYKSKYTRVTIRGDLWKGFYSDMMNVTKEGEIEFKNGKKPVRLIKQLAKWIGMEGSDIVLDFFSGSATTAQAMIELNLEYDSTIKYIMVQLPQQTKEIADSYRNICEIGKERIRRAGDKIVSENKEKDGIKDLDIGFKVLKLDSSNIKKWNPNYDNLEQSFDDMLENFVPNRSEEDVVYEIMLKYGIDLTYPVEEKIINGKKIYSVGFGALIICLDNDITLDVIEGIVEVKKELSPEVCRVVFKDNGFANDSVKTNAIQILRRNNIKEVMSI
ncbi:site-specific DNA-methyltransferase [Clostridium sp.]|uniref:site-specific DNA-methyltransferase n=1 Tax=Clostridium sp. TaxID=1506 RepID=UPI0025BF510A|nr:site-specific DNA-methyltransferase [Clostridium sp.]